MSPSHDDVTLYTLVNLVHKRRKIWLTHPRSIIIAIVSPVFSLNLAKILHAYIEND